MVDTTLVILFSFRNVKTLTKSHALRVGKTLRKTFSMSSFAEWENEKMKPSSKNNNPLLILLSWNNIRILKTFPTHKNQLGLGIRLRIEYNRHYPNCIDSSKTGRDENDFSIGEVYTYRLQWLLARLKLGSPPIIRCSQFN